MNDHGHSTVMDIDSYFKEANELYSELQLDHSRVWHMVQHDSCQSSLEIYTRVCMPIPHSDNRVCRVEYRIGYSTAFSAPLLYMKAEDECGNAIDRDRFQQLLADRFHFDGDQWKYVSQVDHRFLGRPYLSAHPCRTNVAIRQLQLALNVAAAGGNGLKLWLRSFGNVFGLNIG